MFQTDLSHHGLKAHDHTAQRLTLQVMEKSWRVESRGAKRDYGKPCVHCSPSGPLLNLPVVDICGVISGMSTNSPIRPPFPGGVEANILSSSAQLPLHSCSTDYNVAHATPASDGFMDDNRVNSTTTITTTSPSAAA